MRYVVLSLVLMLCGCEVRSSLDSQVKGLNAEAKKDTVIGKYQEPLTEEEVVAAIENWERGENPASDAVFAEYQKIIRTSSLPKSGKLVSPSTAEEETTEEESTEEPATQEASAEEVEFPEGAMWWVDLVLQFDDGTKYAYRIREETARSPLEDAVEDLNAEAQLDEELTADEVVDAIKKWDRDAIPASDEMFKEYETIATLRSLSDNEELVVQSVPGENLQSVELVITNDDGSKYAFQIR